MKTNYILTHKWVVKVNGLSETPKIVCPVDADWPERLTHKVQQDGFEVIGPLDHYRYDDQAILIAEHIVELHNRSL